MYRDRDMPMEDTGIKNNARPQAGEIIEQLSTQAMKFRALCREQMEQAQQELDHWRAQHDQITSFLVEDQLAGPVSGSEDIMMPTASRVRREMGGQ